jgi:hypothetical protein
MSRRQEHRKNKPPRDRSHKRYKPKHIHLPVMKGLRDEFALVLHSALTAAELGHFSKDQYDRIGQAINTIWGALELRPPKGSAAAKLVIEGAMRAVNDAGRRGDVTDVWVLRDWEQAAVMAGIQKAEEILLRLDVFTLNKAIEQINIMKAEDRSAEKKFIVKNGEQTVSIDIRDIQSVTIVEMDETNKPLCAYKAVRGEEERIAA